MMFRETTVVKHDGAIGADEYTLIARHALRHESDIYLEYKRATVNAKSIMGVLTLGLRDGDKVTVVVKGGIDEEAALDDMCAVMKGFSKKG